MTITAHTNTDSFRASRAIQLAHPHGAYTPHSTGFLFTWGLWMGGLTTRGVWISRFRRHRRDLRFAWVWAPGKSQPAHERGAS